MWLAYALKYIPAQRSDPSMQDKDLFSSKIVLNIGIPKSTQKWKK